MANREESAITKVRRKIRWIRAEMINVCEGETKRMSGQWKRMNSMIWVVVSVIPMFPISSSSLRPKYERCR